MADPTTTTMAPKFSRTCSQCGMNGRNSRTCTDSGDNGFVLFGVRLTEGSLRKSASMNNLSHLDQQAQDATAGYASDDAVKASGRSLDRKRGVPWTEEEHWRFLLGLQKAGRGDWRGISRNFVKTRTPTQVASHAQKYFLRRSNVNSRRRRRRSSLLDITTDAVMNSAVDDEVRQEEEKPNSKPHTAIALPNFAMTISPAISPTAVAGESSAERLTLGNCSQSKASSGKLVSPVSILPVAPSSTMADLNLNQSPRSPDSEYPTPLSLMLSTTASDEQSPASFQPMSRGFSGRGDSIISVA
ncbi:hypothetical protein Nepgr_032987 [Nepenthes gracilis]|uniref:Uncharacterized protein n=1 Tax=Nepenthes gracilis TaxID=150966 RepID=A0AAD3TL73_NEPGR|nr:hypothetical protein Nepgr_032987 [Nepenthes gracilis]